MSSRTARAIQRNPVSKKKKNNNKTNKQKTKKEMIFCSQSSRVVILADAYLSIHVHCAVLRLTL